MRSRIHQVLQNPIYYGEFYWLGQLHQGLHKPIISRDLFDRVQQVFAAANRPRHTKRRHAFAGLVTCGRCGCAYTAETKKGQYVYYHCTGHRGPCGNTYVREEELISQFGSILQQVRIPTELAGKLATVLRESQADKEKFVRTSASAPATTDAAALQIRSGLRGPPQRCDSRGTLELKVSGVAGGASPGSNRDGASRGRQSGIRDRGAADSRTRANRVFLVCCRETARTGASGQNAGIELHVQSRNSHACLH